MGVVESMYSDMFEDQEMHKLMVLPGIKTPILQERINDAAEEFGGKAGEVQGARAGGKFRKSTEKLVYGQLRIRMIS